MDSPSSSQKQNDMWFNSSFGFDEDDINEDFVEMNSSAAKVSKSKSTNRKRKKRLISNSLSTLELSSNEIANDSYQHADDKCINWQCKYEPQCKEDLAVSNQKIAEISVWFKKHFERLESEDNLHNFASYKNDVRSLVNPFLLLYGPTGSSKTSCVKVLAKEFGVEIKQFVIKNNLSTSEDYIDERRKFDHDLDIKKEGFHFTQEKLFKNFFLSEFKYSTIQHNQVLNSCSENTGISNGFCHQDKELLLIEDIPNVFYMKPNLFHEILRKARNRFVSQRIPAVFIISENGHSDAYKLIPKQLQVELGMEVINFRPITDTALSKALSKICGEQLSKDEIRAIVSQCCGDIRSAINTLEIKYAHLLSKTDQNKKRKDSGGRARKKAKFVTHTKLDPGGRDVCISLPHLVGKVLYAKRSKEDDECQLSDSRLALPNHLLQYNRDPLIENPDNVVEKIPVRKDTFNLWLHEHYIDFMANIDHALQCIHNISEAELCSVGFDVEHKSILENYQSVIAVRGLMFNVQHPSTNMTNDHDTGNASVDKVRKRTFKSFSKPQLAGLKNAREKLKKQLNVASAQMLNFPSCHALLTDIVPFICPMIDYSNDVNFGVFKQLGKYFNIEQAEGRRNNSQSDNSVIDDFEQNEYNVNESKCTSSSPKSSFNETSSRSLMFRSQDNDFVIEDYSD